MTYCRPQESVPYPILPKRPDSRCLTRVPRGITRTPSEGDEGAEIPRLLHLVACSIGDVDADDPDANGCVGVRREFDGPTGGDSRVVVVHGIRGHHPERNPRSGVVLDSAGEGDLTVVACVRDSVAAGRSGDGGERMVGHVRVFAFAV